MSAVVLTENIVLSRTRSHDLKDVRKLNCWNFELTDVSMVRRMPSVQVLSLSLNKIKTLADFAFCPELEELYLRKNEINDINEVFYLTNLSKLRKLWLADNPCADYANYRNTVLKALPDLEILDNIPVQDDGMQLLLQLITRTGSVKLICCFCFFAEVRRADELGDDIYDPDEKPARVERAEVESVAESDDHVFTENEAEHEHSSSDFEQMNKVQNGTNNGQSRHAYVAHCESDYQPVILASNTAESSTIANKMAHTRLSYSQNDGDWIGNSNKDNTPRSAAHSMSHNSRASSVSASTPRHTNHSQTPALRYV